MLVVFFFGVPVRSIHFTLCFSTFILYLMVHKKWLMRGDPKKHTLFFLSSSSCLSIVVWRRLVTFLELINTVESV